MELKKINANIARVRRNGEAFNTLVQETAVAIIAHALACGDCTPALRLVQAMPKSARRGLLIDFFARYSPIGMNVGTGKVRLHKEGSKAYNPYDVQGATDNPWFIVQEADEDLPDTTLTDVVTAMGKLVKKYRTQIDEGRIPANDIEAVKVRLAAVEKIAALAA